MKFIKGNLKLIIGFLIGVILASGVTVYAYGFLASDVKYTKENGTDISVEDALNELYNKNSNLINSDENTKKLINFLGSIDTTAEEVLYSPFWLKRLIANNQAFDYLCSNNTYLQYVFNSEEGMRSIAKSSYALNKVLKNYYSSFINSSYLSAADQHAIQVPTMTGNTTPSGVVSASTEALPAYFAFDKKSDMGSSRSAWNATKYNNGYIQYKFDRPNRIYKFTLENLSDGATNYVTSFTLQGSNDGTNFSDIYSGTNGSGNNTKRSFLIPNLQNRYQYYRIVVNGKGGNWTGFGEINFYCFDVE